MVYEMRKAEWTVFATTENERDTLLAEGYVIVRHGKNINKITGMSKSLADRISKMV